jgi:hypothetical protein
MVDLLVGGNLEAVLAARRMLITMLRQTLQFCAYDMTLGICVVLLYVAATVALLVIQSGPYADPQVQVRGDARFGQWEVTLSVPN